MYEVSIKMTLPPDSMLSDTPRAETPETEEASQDTDKYSAFTKLEKYAIVSMVSYASWSSNMSSFILLPALKPLSEAFNVSIARINLAVTVYLAVGAVVPLFVGDAADVLGRRAAYIFTLSVFAVANVGLALADSYGMFMGLRVLQAVGQTGKTLAAALHVDVPLLTQDC